MNVENLGHFVDVTVFLLPERELREFPQLQ